MAWKRRKKKPRFYWPSPPVFQIPRVRMWVETFPGSGAMMDFGNIENVTIKIDPA